MRHSKLITSACCICILLVLTAGVFDAGIKHGTAACKAEQATANAQAQATANTQTKTAVKRATNAGQAQEKSRATVDQFFDQLQKDASHEQAAAPASTCSLSDARLRLWNYANTGRADPVNPDTAPSQSDPSTPTTATSSIGPVGGLGSQPPAGDTGIPPVGSTHVQPAGLPGDQP